ncbi:unnamed protein product [Calicophoron daubneyi]|uniref:Uncharacterized protein n=1 Tax=Calicophoron daubneyi TaxID=300641 RepID=A0AAV2TTC4_CALDB
MRGLAKAAGTADVKLEWSSAKEVLLAAFSGLAGRQAAVQRCNDANLSTGSDPFVIAMFLGKELSRKLPNLDKSSGDSMLRDEFLNAMSTQIANQLKSAALVRQMTLEEMTEAVQILSSEQNLVTSLKRSLDESGLQRLQDTVEKITQEVAARQYEMRGIEDQRNRQSKKGDSEAILQVTRFWLARPKTIVSSVTSLNY